jgi:hypothetical protein
MVMSTNGTMTFFGSACVGFAHVVSKYFCPLLFFLNALTKQDVQN